MGDEKRLEKILGRKVLIGKNSIKFDEGEKELIATFRLNGLPSCCGATTLFYFNLKVKTEDLSAEKIIIKTIEKRAGQSWSFIQTTTRNPRKIRLFTETGWSLKAQFNSDKGMTYLFQKKIPKTKSLKSTSDDNW